MEEKVINNLSCREITNVKKVYYIWYDNYLSIEKIKREELWRINKLNLKPDILPMLFNVDVDEWNWDESGDKTSNGGLFERQLKGFVPKLNEWAESYFNEMLRRPMCIFIETFDESVYLFGGESPRTTFTFTKSISSRNGYDLVFTCLSEESSLIINDEDFFQAAPDTGLTCEPVTINLDGTDILIADSGSIVTINLEDTDENLVIPNDVQVVGNNIKLVFPVAEYNLDLVDRFGNTFPTKQVSANATWDLRTLTPFDWADLFLSRETSWGGSTIENALIDCVDDLFAAGLWEKLISFHPHIGTTANNHAWNAKYPFNKRTSFYELYNGTTHDADGVYLSTGDTKTNFMNPLLNADVNSFTYGFFQTSDFDNNAATTNNTAIDNTLSSRGCQLAIRPSDGRIVWGINENAAFGLYTPASQPSYIGRHTAMSRTAASGAGSQNLYIDGVSVATRTSASMQFGPGLLYGTEIWCKVGGAIQVSNMAVLLAKMGSEYSASGLNSTEIADLHIALSTFESIVR